MTNTITVYTSVTKTPREINLLAVKIQLKSS